MTPLVQLIIDMLLEHVVRPAIEERFGGTIPGAVLSAIATRIFKIIEEGHTSSYTTIKKLVLYAVDETVREYEVKA